MTKKKRRRFSPEEKVKAIKSHVLENEDVSSICQRLSIHPNQYYDWQKQFFENGEKAFIKQSKVQLKNLETKVEKLQDELKHKDFVIATIVEDNISLKKNLGEN